jgi:glycosyltransferase involved in cell wall biosynthesis
MEVKIPPRWARGVIGMGWGAWQVRRAARARRYDAVLAPEWMGLAALLPASTTLVTNLVTGAQLVDEVVGGTRPGTGRLGRTSRLAQYRLEARQVRRSTGVIAISTSILSWYRSRLGIEAPGHVIPNCIDVEHVARAAVEAPRPETWPDGQDVLLFAGRLERRKGILATLEAFRSLSGDYAHVSLVLAGAASDPDVRLDDVGSRVVILGDVRGDALYRAMHDASVVLCPSLWEAFGNVALEAKASGTPVVATSGSGFDDFCEDGSDALLVAPGSAAELEVACRRLLDDSDLRARLAARAGDSVRAYSPQRTVPRYADALRQVVRGRA